MEAILLYLKREPVAVMTAVKALLAVLIVFGIPLPPGLDVALAGLVVALLTIFTRSLVSPVEEAEDDTEADAEEVPAEDPIEEAPDAVPRDEEE